MRTSLGFPCLAIALSLTHTATLAHAGPVTHPGYDVPAQIPPSWVGPQAAAGIWNLKPSRPTVAPSDQRRYGTSTSERTPLCISQNGWVGGAYVFRGGGQPDRAYCVVHDGSGKLEVDTPALLLEPREGVPQNWLRWGSGLIEPRGAAIAFAQDNGRQLRACAAEAAGAPAKTVFGYVGDDGRCYGVELEGFRREGNKVQALGERKGYDSYMLLMRGSMTGEALRPEEGWLTVKSALLPRGRLLRAGHPGVPGASPVACRGRQGSDWWPGHVDDNTKQCRLFTSYQGVTGRAAVSDYEVFRYARCTLGNGVSIKMGELSTIDGLCTFPDGSKTQVFSTYVPPAPPTNGQYSTVGGKGYYLCAAETNGGTKKFLGFTNQVFPHTSQLNGCTDGTSSAQAHPSNSSPQSKVWILLAPGDTRG
jgi:hypothetical protein